MHGNITTEHNEEIIRMDKKAQSVDKTEWKAKDGEMVLRGTVEPPGCKLGRRDLFGQ